MTPAPSLDRVELKALEPCREKYAEIAKLMGQRRWTAMQARGAGVSFDAVVWAASAVAHNDKDIERRLRLWLADCAAHVLHLYERDYPNDTRPRDAIITARQFARGEIRAAAQHAAEAAAWDAAKAAVWDAAWDAGNAAFAAAWAAAWDVAKAAAWDAARAAESRWQYDRLVLWLSANEPEDIALPQAQERAA